MGCTVSETSQPRSVAREQPRPPLLSHQIVPEDVKSLIWGFIEKDDVKALSFMIRQNEIDLRAEILCQKSYTTMLHLAARYNADLCAVFLLRKLYEEDPSTYIESLNMQTIEGSTALMQAVIWGSHQTFLQLIEYGGVDLYLKNIRGVDIFQEAKSYKREQMLKYLSEFKANGVYLIRTNTQELNKPLTFQDIILMSQTEIEETKKKRRIRNSDHKTRRNKQKGFYTTTKDQNILQLEKEIRDLVEIGQRDRSKYFKRLENISLEEAKLRLEELEKKKRMEEELIKAQEVKLIDEVVIVSINSDQPGGDSEQIGSAELQIIEQKKQECEQEIKRVNDQLLKKQKQLQEQKERQEHQEVQKQIQRQNERLVMEANRILEEKRQAQLKSKQEEEAKRKELQELEKKQELEQIERIKREQEQKLEKQRKIDEETKKFEEELQRKKEEALKKASLPIQVTKTLNKQKGVGVLPAELKELYQKALAKGTNFIDEKFKPQRATIGKPPKPNKTVESSVWYRPRDIFNSDYELFDGIDPSDIKQGALGVCYYLATLSSLAENQERIREMFPFHDKELGFYVVQLYINGVSTNIVVDDYFPCSAGSKVPLFCRPNGKQIWVMILQKAWVKNFGDYFASEGMTPDLMMEDVVGAPSKGAYIKNIVEELPFLAACDKKKHILVLSSVSENIPQGIVSGHAYSLIDIHDSITPNLVKIRNPWGSFEWNGDYGDKSTKWNDDLKKKLNVTDEQDGIFYMTPHEIPVGFCYYSVSMIVDNAKYKCLDFKSKASEDIYWTFEIGGHQKQAVNIRVIQPFDRFLPDSSYTYSPLIFECGWIKSDKEVVMMGEGSDNSVFGEKTAHFHEDLFLELNPGKYFIRVKMFWNNSKYNSACLISYSVADITFKQVQPEQIKPEWLKMLTSVLATCNKSSILSGNISLMQKWMKGQYIIGVKNNSKTAYELTISLSQKDFKNCNVIYGKTKPNEIKFIVEAGETKLAGVADKIALNVQSSIGKLSFSGVQK